MTLIKDSFQKVLTNYPTARKQPLKKHPLAQFLKNEAPVLIQKQAGLGKPYIIEGSAGKGNWAEVPWICVFDEEITKSARRGYYCVYLFNAKGKSAYLSLNLGWTQFSDAFPRKEAAKKILNAVKNCRFTLTDKLGDFNTSPMMLDAEQSLAKGYELGHICSKRYPKEQIPSDEVLVADLKEMLQVYADLKSFIGKKNVVTSLVEIQKKTAIEEDAKDSSYQIEINSPGAEIDLPNGPLDRGKPGKTKESVRWKGDARVAKKVCKTKNYLCEVGDHPTFISKATDQPYIEAHHLIPIAYQDEFQNSLDVPENILILCPICHRQFHHSRHDRRDLILEKFYHERKAGLIDRGIEISLAKLKEYY